MPERPATICRHCNEVMDPDCPNGCGSIKKAGEVDRPSSSARGYDRTWRKFRHLYFAHHSPLCHDCTLAGRTTAATDLHHKKKIKHRPDLRLAEENILPLCKRCHDARSAKGE